MQLYRSLAELWTVKSDGYKNSSLKDAGCDELVEKPREIEDDADRDMVRKKINGLRTACRRELKKITDSSKSGIGTDDIYVPSLWYFDDSDFLRHHEMQVAGKSTIEDICQETDVCANLIVSCMDTVSCCTTRFCANLFDRVWGRLL